MQCNRILIPLDASALGENALSVALSLAQAWDADVYMLHVRPDAASLDADKANDEMEELEQEADNLTHLAEKNAPDGFDMSRLHSEVRAGPVVQVILDAIDELRIDLVVMATHGRKGVAEMFTGSTTERVLNQSPASVFAVKAEGFPFLRDD